MKQLAQLLTACALSILVASGAAAFDLWTGGVSEHERSDAPERNTRVEFFVDSGSYLSNVYFELYTDTGTRILDGHSDGPWVMMELFPGEYSIRGTREDTGEAQSVRFFVEDGRNHVFGLRFTE
ncbi:MAG: hypothetical protein LAT65_09505 [Saccharospirillum sp.]|nr:hypothetical protein [Saccharospirillum sp.]